ncbi:MAG: hypothetical protein Q7J34_09245 [Bacteroidales bacterium]|nr:hypothetical protein [Bacteroidales bacterium]
MKKNILWIALLGFLIFSCDKESPKPKNEIVFFDLQPDISITTIRDYYTSMNPFCGQLPLPNDSIAYFDLDLNNDSEIDFQIEVRHYQQELTQYCGHCGIFHIKTIQIKPINSNGFISLDTVSNYWIRNYDTTQLISSSDSWTNENVTGLLTDGCMIPSLSFKDTYWGLKLDNMIAWIHLERIGNNGLKIKEFAYNSTENNSIIAGQKE